MRKNKIKSFFEKIKRALKPREKEPVTDEEKRTAFRKNFMESHREYNLTDLCIYYCELSGGNSILAGFVLRTEVDKKNFEENNCRQCVEVLKNEMKASGLYDYNEFDYMVLSQEYIDKDCCGILYYAMM